MDDARFGSKPENLRAQDFRFAPESRHRAIQSAGPFRANKRHRATTEGRPTSLFRREQLAGENIDEVHLTDDDKPLN
jgi:hypothetical protein